MQLVTFGEAMLRLTPRGSSFDVYVGAAARAERLTISYDLNFRPKLWSPERARVVQEPLQQFADLFIAGEDAARLVFGLDDGSAEDVGRELQQRYALPAVAITVRDSKR